MVDGQVERLCNKCSAWWLLKKFRKAKGCHRGRSNECSLCFNQRKAANRALAALRKQSPLCAVVEDCFSERRSGRVKAS